MKLLLKKYSLVFTLLTIFIFFSSVYGQNTGINETGASPNVSAGLDIDFTDKGLLIPRMTTTERNNIVSSANSLLIYNTTTECFEAYHATTSSWVSISCLGCQLPGSFLASAASNIDQTSFDANWTSSAGATTYFLDVDDNSDFSSPLVGYDGLNVGNVTTYSITGLTCNTTYYYRLRANNSCGSSSNSNTVTTTTTNACDIFCGSQYWAPDNINVGTRINGAPGGQNMTTPGGDQKYCFNDLEANCTTYGGLYEWDEMMNYAGSVSCDPCGPTTGNGGVQGICPSGYHIPSDLEWSRYEFCVESTIAPTGSTTLVDFQTGFNLWRGTNSSAGPAAKMKVTASDTPSWDGSNSSGFSAMSSGWRISSDGSFVNMGGIPAARFWSATETAANAAQNRVLASSDSRIKRDNGLKLFGFSVRCLKD